MYLLNSRTVLLKKKKKKKMDRSNVSDNWSSNWGSPVCKRTSSDNAVTVTVKLFRKHDWVCRDNHIRVHCHIPVVHWRMTCSLHAVMDKILVTIVFDFKYNILRWRYNNDMNIDRKHKSFLVWKKPRLFAHGTYISIINICLGKNPGPLCMLLAARPVCIEPIKS